MKRRWMFRGLKMVVFFAIGTLLIGLIVLQLWNALIPELFKGPQLSFWQAVGLLVLSHILLRGWGRGGYAGGWRRERWRNRFEEKLAAMAPEEREKFRAEWRHRCGPGSSEPTPGTK